MSIWHDWQGRAWYTDENGNPTERAPEHDIPDDAGPCESGWRNPAAGYA